MRYLKDHWKVYFVLTLAVVCIFFKFTLIPDRLAHDEVEFGRLVQSLDGTAYMPFSALADGHATVYFYILLLSTKVFGMTMFGLRFPAAIFGVGSVLLFYLLMRQFFEKKSYVPFFASILFLTSHWFLNFARFSFEMPYLLFLELGSLLALGKVEGLGALGTKGTLRIVMSGILAGLAFNSYQPGRIFFLLPLFLLIIKRVSLRQIFFYLGAFVIMILPMTLYLYQHPEGDIRIGQQLYFKNTELSTQEKLSFLGQNIYRTGAMLYGKGDLNGRHNYPGKPAINPILGILVILGLLLGIRRWKEFPNQLSFGYLGIAILPTLLTYPWENPNMLRTYTALPALFYFIALALSEGMKKYEKYALPIIIALVLVSAGYELRTYFRYQAQVFPHAFERGKNLQLELDLYEKNTKQYLKKIGR